MKLISTYKERYERRTWAYIFRFVTLCLFATAFLSCSKRRQNLRFLAKCPLPLKAYNFKTFAVKCFRTILLSSAVLK